MAEVKLNIAGYLYAVACSDADEDRLENLGVQIDQTARRLLDELGPISESRLMLMVAILLCDRLEDTKEKAKRMGYLADDQVADILDQVTNRVEDMARLLESETEIR